MIAAFGRILRSTKELMPFYVIVMISSILTAGLALAAPFLVKNATDTIVPRCRASSPATPHCRP